MIKIDTEGHDVVILEDLKHFNFRPPIIWTEWFEMYKFVNISNKLLLEIKFEINRIQVHDASKLQSK